MNGSGRNEFFAATLVALALAACTPFDTAAPDGGDGASGSKGGAAGAGGAATAGSGGIVGGGAGANTSGGAGASGIAGGTAGSLPDAGADAHVDMAAGGNGGTNLKMPGALCAKPSECASDFCVDGVCCATACTQGCMACSTDKTGSASGTCAPVKAGIPHANDCIAADPTSCGHDGKCDGAGACRNFASGTPCANESCTDAASVSNYSSARACDGHGVCALASTSNCGSAYRCSGTKCRTTCAGAGDCISADYCTGTTCVAKKADGQPCASATECAQGVCGGLCCAAGCTCTQPSPGNILKNAGFDKDTSGWMAESGSFSRSLSDAQTCAYSGSLTTTVAPGGQNVVSECVSNTPLVGDFNFGAKIEASNSSAVAFCQVNFYSGFNCDADLVSQNETDLSTGSAGYFENNTTTFPLMVFGSNSVKFSCYFQSVMSTESTFWLDMVYVSKTGRY
jgi:hypothetical protein